MSLANATKDVTAHPGKNSVTSPTVRENMQADVDRKMRLYGVIEAFRAGKLPDNAQIDETLRYVEEHSPVDLKKLSPDGRQLIQDARDIIETARLMVKQKNADELFQNFVHHTTATDFQKAKVGSDVIPVDKEDAKEDGRQAVEHLRTLLTLVLTNSEARKLLSDVSVIGRDLFARGAGKAAEKARPSPEQLARVDDAAPAETWESRDGQTGTGQTPILGGTNSKGMGVAHDPKTGSTQIHTGDTTFSPTEAKNRAMGAYNETKAEATDRARREADGVAQTAESRGNTDEEKAEVGKQTLKDKLRDGYNSMRDRIPDEHKDRARGEWDNAKQFLKDEFPEERRDQYIYRLKKVIVECQKHQDYTSAIIWFLDTIENYFNHGKVAVKKSASSSGEVTEDPSLQRATSELRTLLERFANGKSLDGIENAARALWDDAQKDEELRNWFRELDEFARKTLLEPGYVLSPACTHRSDQLQDSGHAFFDQKYKSHKDNLFDEVGNWFKAWADDPLNLRFSRDWKRLTKDLLFDENGGLTFKPHLWHDIRKVILPSLIEQVGYIPIPRIEYTDNTLDLVIENLTLQGQNLFPNIISLEAHNFMQFSPYDTIPDKNAHEFTFTFSHIQADMRDVAFYFNKKTGLPKMKDSGLADVFLGGEGLTIKVHLSSAGKDKTSVFKVKDVHVKLDSLKFSVRDSKHDLLYKTLKPLATGLVKKQIAKAITDAITTGFEYIDEQLVQVRDRMAEAKGNDEKSRADVLKEMFERKQEEVNSKKSKTDSQFKIVAKRDSVLIPNAGHESGLINKQAEREAAAHEGEGWKSKAFSIIDPPQSTAAGTHTDASRV